VGQTLANPSAAPLGGIRVGPKFAGADHVAEMMVTSSVMPPVAVAWRLYGGVRYRVLFW
jgi:hypothetical protein